MATYHHIIFNASPSKNPDYKAEQDENYRRLFNQYRPSEILVFTTHTIANIHSGLISCASDYDIEPKVHEIEDLPPPPNWTNEELATKPHRILSNMIDGFNQSGLNRSQTLVTIAGGGALYSSLLLVLSRIIGASVVLNEGDRSEPDYQIQPWLSRIENYTQIKRHEIKLLETFLQSKTDSNFSRTKLSNFWKSAKEISGTATTASKSKGFSSTVSELLENGLLQSNTGTPVQYRLTAKGWTAALSNIQIDSDDLTNARSSRITGFRLHLDREGNIPAIRIATSLQPVEDWLTIMGLERGQKDGGITLFDDKNPSPILSEDQINMHNEWKNFLSSMEMREHSWGLFDVVGDLDEVFCEFCEWLWPRLTGTQPQRFWSLDLTQFTNKQIPMIAHFAFSTGIPMTWTSAPFGHTGVKTGKVSHDIQNRSDRILSIPNLDFSKYLIEGGKDELGVNIRVLLALLFQEEQYYSDNADNLQNANPYKKEVPKSIGVRGADKYSLAIYVANHADTVVREKLAFKDNASTTRAYQKMVREDLIRIESPPDDSESKSEDRKSGKHHLTLSPMGRLVARILRDRMLSTMEEE